MDALRRASLQLALLLAAWPVAADEVDSEVRVKAAFVYRFTGYIDWPESIFAAADAPFVLGVLGAEPMFAELSQLLAQRRIQDRRVQLRQLRDGDAFSGLQLLFVGREHRGRLPLPPPPGLLIVTELDAGMPRGSVINLLLVERRLRFEVALANAEKAGLRLSSRLLAVAQRVHAGEGD